MGENKKLPYGKSADKLMMEDSFVFLIKQQCC